MTAPQRIVVLGGTSEIAVATLRAMPLDLDTRVVLAGRDEDALRDVGAGLSATVVTCHFDALSWDTHQALVDGMFAGGPVDVVLFAFGILGEHPRAESDAEHALDVFDVDLRAHVSLLLRTAAAMRERGTGTLVVFSSVAAVRARRANFTYGAAKAGLDALASGLADSLHGSGVRVVLVRPGFVVGRMTRGMRPLPFAVDPDAVGRATAAAVATGQSVVWVPTVLRLIAPLLRAVPRSAWRRLRR